ncbi:MAG TPA: TlpA disulfide reductase family protein [Terriglobia bacterium]|nr:TlpA disulfide reductase family protein [Terriglobia bacterium]
MAPRKTLLLALAFIVFIGVSGWITERAKQLDLPSDVGTDSELIGSPAPDFTLKALDGREVKLSDYRGKETVVVAFWASWCGPCRMEMPSLQSFYEQHRGKGVEVLALSIDDDPSLAQKYAEQSHLPFPVLIDNNQDAASQYHVEGIPVIFVVDPTGKVRFALEGLNPSLETVLTAELNSGGFAPPKQK